MGVNSITDIEQRRFLFTILQIRKLCIQIRQEEYNFEIPRQMERGPQATREWNHPIHVIVRHTTAPPPPPPFPTMPATFHMSGALHHVFLVQSPRGATSCSGTSTFGAPLQEAAAAARIRQQLGVVGEHPIHASQYAMDLSSTALAADNAEVSSLR